MAIDYAKLLDLFPLEDIPACDEGMDLAHKYLQAYVEALSQPEKQIAVRCFWTLYFEHRSGCDNCNEV